MSKIILLLSMSLFFTVANGKAPEDTLDKLCDKGLDKKLSQFESNKKQISTRAKKITSERAKSNFENTPYYEWARFASPESIGKLLKPADNDSCSKHYKDFIETKEAKTADEKLELWRVCLNSDYRDSIPQMAKNLLECHGAKAKEEMANEEKAPPEEE